MTHTAFARPLLYILLFILVVVALFPVFFTISTSLKKADEILTPDAKLLPSRPTLEAYRVLINPPRFHSVAQRFGKASFVRLIANTLAYAVATIVISVPLASMAAFTLAREYIPMKWILIAFLLFCYLLPPISLLVPIFKLITALGIYDSFFGLILSYQIFVLPLCTWMLYGYFKTLPKDLDESAYIEGCSKLKTLIYIIIPISAPAVAAVIVFGMIVVWQEFMFTLVLVKSETLRNVQVGMQYFFGPNQPVQWNIVMAAATIVAIPMAILFAYVQQHLVGGLLTGALKG